VKRKFLRQRSRRFSNFSGNHNVKMTIFTSGRTQFNDLTAGFWPDLRKKTSLGEEA
jgi:hypothetical protein